jgi:mono/diheme cytochrome c family protein
MRPFIVFGFCLAALLVGGLAVLILWPLPPPGAIAAVTGDAKRGAYLARLSGCVACHTASGKPSFSGGPALTSPFGSFFAPNITPDPEAGIGDWTFPQFVRAVRQGVSPRGQPYYPAFPYEFYSTLTDRDLADLWAALQALPPVETPSQQHAVGFPFNVREGLKIWKSVFEQPAAYAPRADKSMAWNRGRYIVAGPAHCGACHTPRNVAGGLLAKTGLTGDPAMMDGGKSPPITTGALRERGYTKESLIAMLRTGVLPDGDAVGGSMVEVVHGSTTFLLTEHLNDIATYLLDLE